MTFVNIPLVIELFKYFLYNLFVVIVGRAYKLVIACVKTVPHAADFTRNLINVFFRCNTLRLGDFLDFLSVLVRTRHQIYVKAHHTLVARYHIR